MQNHHSQNELPPSSSELLGQLLDQSLSPAGVTASKFRADNYSMVQALDDLESRRLIKKVGARYSVTTAAILMLETDTAKRISSNIEELYRIFRENYKLTQEEPILVSKLAAAAQISPEDAITGLTLMLENSLWCTGHSIDLALPDATVKPSEGVLKYTTFSAVENEVQSWSRPTVFSASTETPRLQKSTATTSQANSMLVAWPAIRACLQEFVFYDIKEIAGLAGLNVTALSHLIQKQHGGSSKGELMSVIDAEFGKLLPNVKFAF